MKLYTTIILLFASSIALATAQVRKVGEADGMPKDGFADFSELQKWASTSSFGGGGAGKVRIGGKDVYYSDRMFTSGRVTSELIFFVESHDGRIREFLLAPTQLKEHRISTEHNMIIVKCYDSLGKDWQVAMMISPWMLPDSTNQPIKREAALDNPLPAPSQIRRVATNLNLNRRGAPGSGCQASTFAVHANAGELKPGPHVLELDVPAMANGKKMIELKGQLKVEDDTFTFETKGMTGNPVTIHGKRVDKRIVMWTSNEEKGNPVTFHFTGEASDEEGESASGELSLFAGHEKIASGKWKLKAGE